ncbi:MAG TPA: multidrug ABC transporter permease, partial [Erythrobacter sp.]|nr:multidrug ABC transporter permease [Erythrobacter sp.]HAG36502.1 multidrug ABC transporter permease [Erythrobacter sp.]HBC15135.1 multidrug ABC transporter permease [Erythrobacter sp.]
NATGNFTKIVQRVPVRISIQASPEILRLLVPGMSVVASVDTRAARDQLDSIRNAAGD